MTDGLPVERSLLAETTRLVEEKLETLAPGLLGRRPVASYLSALDDDERVAAYQQVPDRCRRTIDEADGEAGAEGAQLYQQLVLLTLIAQFENRRVRARLPVAAMPDLVRALDRIVEQIGRGTTGYHTWDNDLFLKDLHVCRLRLVPSGPELIDLLSGVPRSVLLSGGAGQLLGGGLFLLARTHGLKPFFELHSHRWSMGEFNEAGYEKCYGVVAALLVEHPEARGLLSKSWWHDPQVAELSPELAFLSDTPLNHGAKLFRENSDADTIADATNFAPARKQPFDEGRYLPCNYLVVWPRRDLLAWARAHGHVGG